MLLRITVLLALVEQLTEQGFKIFSRLCELVEARVHGRSFVNTVFVVYGRSKQGLSVSVE